MLTVNETPYPYRAGMRMGELADRVKPAADLLLVNGHPVSRQTPLRDNDRCVLIKRGELPTVLEMEQALVGRQGKENQNRLSRACVGIMGLGGLGSAVAVSLVKIGIGKLLISDYDVVELSNIHRQQYFLDQIGKKKTAALKETLTRINPYVSVLVKDVALTKDNIPEIFQQADVLVECFDNPTLKADALRTALTSLSGIGYVGSSGMAGTGPGDEIRCRRLRPGVYIVGDEHSDTRDKGSLFATRVGIAALQQAHLAVRILLKETE